MLQYDAWEHVGQYFTWAKTATWFYDVNVAQTTNANLLTTYNTEDTAYHHVDHTVWLSIIAPFVSGFDYILEMGLLYGHAYWTSNTQKNVGSTQTVHYQYQDKFSLNSIPTGTFTIIINQQPSPTTAGLAYAFADIDPSESGLTTYFD